jgi:hypothetical protein
MKPLILLSPIFPSLPQFCSLKFHCSLPVIFFRLWGRKALGKCFLLVEYLKVRLGGMPQAAVGSAIIDLSENLPSQPTKLFNQNVSDKEIKFYNPSTSAFASKLGPTLLT